MNQRINQELQNYILEEINELMGKRKKLSNQFDKIGLIYTKMDNLEKSLSSYNCRFRYDETERIIEGLKNLLKCFECLSDITHLDTVVINKYQKLIKLS